MSYTRDVYCPRCDHRFPIAQDEGEQSAACPQCLAEFEVEWSIDEDGEDVRLVPKGIAPLIIGPPTGTTEAVMLAIEHAMHAQAGVPVYMVEDSLPSSVDLRQALLAEEENLRFIQQNTMSETLSKMFDKMEKWKFPPFTLLEKARMYGMRIENNRKRMRKRVRQLIRNMGLRPDRWKLDMDYDNHWTNNPDGDW